MISKKQDNTGYNPIKSVDVVHACGSCFFFSWNLTQVDLIRYLMSLIVSLYKFPTAMSYSYSQLSCTKLILRSKYIIILTSSNCGMIKKTSYIIRADPEVGNTGHNPPPPPSKPSSYLPVLVTYLLSRKCNKYIKYRMI